MTAETTASILILTSALMHAGVNAITKTADDGLLIRGCMNALALAIALPLTWLVPMPAPGLWPLLLLSMLVHGIYPFVLVSAYRHGDLSAVFPLARGSTPLWVGVLVFAFLGQTMSGRQLFGVLLVSLGIAAFALERVAWTDKRTRLGLLYAAVTGLVIAIYTVIDGVGLRAAQTPYVYMVWFFVLDGVFVTTAVTVARYGAIGAFLRRNWKSGLTAAILGVITYSLALIALSLGSVVEVAALRETSVVFAAILGAFLLREPLGLRRIIASVIVLSGVVIMHAGR